LKRKENNLSYNLFQFANSELSHSAFWAWVLQCYESNASEHLAPRLLAGRFLRKIGISKFGPKIEVITEHCFPGNKKDRFDIFIKDGAGRALVIENKVQAIPDLEQIDRYTRLIKKELKDNLCEVAVVLLSTSFDLDMRSEVRSRCPYLGVEELLEIVDGEPLQHPIIRDYRSYLEAKSSDRQNIKRAIEGQDKEAFKEALATPEGQWFLMAKLTKENGIAGRQYRGQNRSGTPWTQYSFGGVEKDKVRDEIFYRIDDSSKGYYFSLKQYQNDPDDLKQERLIKLRELWEKACREAAPASEQMLRWHKPRSRRSKTKESEIGWLLFKENEPQALANALPLIHKRFELGIREIQNS
jgi:hypothetical protein